MTVQERFCKKGKPYYTATLRIKGHPSRSCSFSTREEAEDWLTETKIKIKRGIDLPQSKREQHTLQELINRYIENELPERNTDHQRFKTHLKWWKKEIGAYYLSSITPALLAECRDKLKNSSNGKGDQLKSNATVNRYMATLSIAYTFAVREWGWVDENPFSKVKKKREDNNRIRFLADKERIKLLKECRSSRSPYLYPVVLMALHTGARFSEIMNLTWDCVDFKRKVVRFMNTKNGENRSVPLSSTLLKELKVLPQNNTTLVFPNKLGDKPADVRDAWNLVIKRTKIEDFRFHDLRHTAASYLAMNGATLVELSHILGHKTMQMVKRYSHLTEQHTADLIERMSKSMLS